MMSLQKRTVWTYILSIGGTLAVGGLAALLSADGMARFEQYVQPPLAPPEWLFPVVWTVLYILMSVSFAMTYEEAEDCRRDVLRVYVLQLALNFAWPILFFRFQLLLAAFVWLVVLEAIIAVMLALYYAVKRTAGLLLIPYFLWVAFAGYLNLAIYILNPTPI